jgi:hypothetical protein
MKMTSMRSSMLCGILLLTAPMLRAQDFSKYRNFSIGTELAVVLKHTDLRLVDVKATHEGSLLFQELTWHPANGIGVAYRSESVDDLVFSFYKGELYKMVVTYDRTLYRATYHSRYGEIDFREIWPGNKRCAGD